MLWSVVVNEIPKKHSASSSQICQAPICKLQLHSDHAECECGAVEAAAAVNTDSRDFRDFSGHNRIILCGHG